MSRHETDILSLTSALIFVSIGVLFVTGEVDPAEFVRLWALPITLLGAGLMLGAFGLARYRRHRLEPQATVESDEGSHPPLW